MRHMVFQKFEFAEYGCSKILICGIWKHNHFLFTEYGISNIFYFHNMEVQLFLFWEYGSSKMLINGILYLENFNLRNIDAQKC